MKLIMGQLEKLNTHLSLDVWKNQTASYVKDIFGEQSEEFKWITNCNIPVVYKEEERPRAEKKFRQTCLLFLVECINTIELKGIYQKPKTNFIQGWDNGTLATAITFSLAVIFGGGTLLGKYLSDVQNMRLEEQNEILVKENNALKDKNTTLENQIKALQEKETSD